MPLPRREIDEILQLHVREGAQVQEVFVEGTADKHFYEAFLAASNLDNVAVLDVGGVNVPDAEVVNLGLAIGKKGRVVTLAALLEGKVSESEVVCIADADLDHFKGTRYGFSLLLLTDGTSIELYVLCPVVLSRILNVALGGFPKSPAQVTEELAGPLQEAFLARVAADDLGFPPHFPEASAFCVFDKHRNALSFKRIRLSNAPVVRLHLVLNWVDERSGISTEASESGRGGEAGCGA